MKKLLAIFIACIPFNLLRIFLYRNLLKYKISYKSKINPLNFICCNELYIEEFAGFKGYFNIVKDVNTLKIKKGTTIKHLNKFKDFNKCELDTNVTIVSKNTFIGTVKNISPFKKHENILIGEDSIITSGHTFDLSDEVEIGKDVTFAGKTSQVWTHGFDLNHTKKQSPVTIGNRCYIGTHSIILPGCKIVDNVSIGAGTIVSKSIESEGFYVSSQLIRKSDTPNFRLEDNVIQKNKNFFLRKN